jgi:3-deoxy-D-manno-octulosonate 8-phosphate phosphatase KdsC-like HAD superfamily phosphatase
MSDASPQILNTVLDRLSHTLLQYIGEAWPWADPLDADCQATIMGLVRRQQFGAERVAELLTERRAIVTLGNYRFDGSFLNYCTFDYLKPQLLADETHLIAELRDAVSSVNGDAGAVRLLEQLIVDEEDTLKQLSEL